jgi:hypothetical protein
MMKLNQDALNYVLAVASEAGFGLLEMSTTESIHDAPTVRLHLRQTKDLTIQHIGSEKIGPKEKATLDNGDD